MQERTIHHKDGRIEHWIVADGSGFLFTLREKAHCVAHTLNKFSLLGNIMFELKRWQRNKKINISVSKWER